MKENNINSSYIPYVELNSYGKNKKEFNIIFNDIVN